MENLHFQLLRTYSNRLVYRYFSIHIQIVVQRRTKSNAAPILSLKSRHPASFPEVIVGVDPTVFHGYALNYIRSEEDCVIQHVPTGSQVVRHIARDSILKGNLHW